MSALEQELECLREESERLQMKVYEVTTFSQKQAGKIKNLEEALRERTRERDVLTQLVQTVHDFTDYEGVEA